MKKTLLSLATLLILSSCAKEEFAANKGLQSGSVSPITTTSNKLCSQHTLISPQVDILMLWDNSSSFNIVTPATRASMGNLIKSVSENFDYHILSVPLISSNANTLFEGQLVVKNDTGLTTDAKNIVRTKEQVASSLSFTSSGSSAEPGIDRAINIIQANRANGIFRQNAYTMIVVISNEDDDSCESETGVYNCGSYDWKPKVQAKINKLLCLRGNTTVSCGSTGVTNPLDSTMMRFVNISPLTACSTGANRINARYREVAKQIYEAPYTNGWPTSNDHLSPDVTGAPDSYNLCSIDFNHIFDGVNAAIKQTLIKHKYDYWPVAGSSADVDPDSLRVVRSDGKILTNRTGETNPTDGYQYVGNLTNQNTRVLPTPGEPFTGKLIRLFGPDGNDRVVYPDCLTVTFNANKLKYGYIYLKYGQPLVSSIEVRVNGVLVPQSTTNGWDYMGNQLVTGLDPNLKVFDLPAGAPSGYMLRLNGTAQFVNSPSSPVSVSVYYNSGATP